MKKALKTTPAAVIVVSLLLAVASCDTGGGSKTEPAHNHDWGNWIQTTAPTTATEGEETRTCSTCGEQQKQPIDKLPTEFTVKLLDKDVTVKDARTGASDQSLEQLGVMTKLRAAITYINDHIGEDSPELVAEYNTVVARGLVIEFNGTGAVDEFSKTRGDRTILLTINGILGYSDNKAIVQISGAIGSYLALGKDKVS
jgi:hypothetical protein